MTAFRLWLCVPPVVLFCMDFGLTLLGQPTDYWTGDYSATNEGNWLAAWVLTIHPLAFVALGLVYCLGVCGAVAFLSRPLSIAVAAWLSFTHAVGVVVWSSQLAQVWALLPLAGTLGTAVLWWRAGRRRGFPICERRRTAALAGTFFVASVLAVSWLYLHDHIRLPSPPTVRTSPSRQWVAGTKGGTLGIPFAVLVAGKQKGWSSVARETHQ